jgi:hypothetical protein
VLSLEFVVLKERCLKLLSSGASTQEAA